MRYAVLALALASMTLTTLGYLGCVALSDQPVEVSGINPTYDANGYLTRTRDGRREIFLPRDPPNEWYPVVSQSAAPVVCHVPSPLKPDAPQTATLHADGTVTLHQGQMK